MNAKDLLKCPFCGGEAGVHETSDGWIVSCSSAQSELDGFTHMSHGYGETEAEAIEAWNTRAEQETHDVSDQPLRFVCDACGCVSLEIVPNYCPCCGRKVVER